MQLVNPIKKLALVILLPLVLINCSAINHTDNTSITSLKPFPQHTNYTQNAIKPNSISQTDLDTKVKTMYDAWKQKYLKQATENQYYVYYYYNDGQELASNIISCSEGHGYGMLITAIMAGYDPQAKTLFDGLYYFFKNHPCSTSAYLMAWQQIDTYQTNPAGGEKSASDGDMDIAYALLLADKQWGSTGTINYLEEAKNVMKAIWDHEINQQKFTIQLGDWCNESQSKTNDLRSSDLMLNHFRIFGTVSQQNYWTSILDQAYTIIQNLYTTYSPNTGLLPDFIIETTTYQPAPANFSESNNDGHYYYNACRTAWRITLDYLISGDTRAFDQLTKLNQWIKTTADNKPENIKTGYQLDGTPIDNEISTCFIAPFGVAAMIDTSNQEWLNKIWAYCVEEDVEKSDYFSNTIKLLCMITMSGNWWTP